METPPEKIKYKYEQFKTKYGNFNQQEFVVIIEDNRFHKNKIGAHIDDIVIDLTSNAEASVACFTIYNCYCANKGFFIKELESFIYAGSVVKICMGYRKKLKDIFYGVITEISFLGNSLKQAGIQITAYDIKKVMMIGKYEKQLIATCYSDAVSEILKQIPYQDKLIKAMKIDDTPDKDKDKGNNKNKEKKPTVGIKSQSYYRFIASAAQKFNYEFFVDCKTIYFRENKKGAATLIELSPGKGILDFKICYDVSEVREIIEVRSPDTAKGESFTGKKKVKNKISLGNKVRELIRDTTQVIEDVNVKSKEEAQALANYYAEKTAYQFAEIRCTIVGLPEIKPGNYVKLTGLNTPRENMFYITNVIHKMSRKDGYKTTLLGKSFSL